jgi:hypothetical protein
MDVSIFISRSVSLVRFEAIARQLAESGVRVDAAVPSIGLITGSIEDAGEIPRLRLIDGVSAVRAKPRS